VLAHHLLRQEQAVRQDVVGKTPLEHRPLHRFPALSALDQVLYYHTMKRQKAGLKAMRAALLASAATLALSLACVAPSFADIYRWEDESGGVHFTDDPSAIPAKHRAKAREIQKTPPAPGKPSVSTMGASPPPGPSFSPRPSNGETLVRPAIPEDDDATQAEKLRAKIDAKERFIRAVDEKQSLATNPYRNRFVSLSDLELYRKYKEELPADRENLKALEYRLAPVR